MAFFSIPNGLEQVSKPGKSRKGRWQGVQRHSLSQTTAQKLQTWPPWRLSSLRHHLAAGSGSQGQGACRLRVTTEQTLENKPSGLLLRSQCGIWVLATKTLEHSYNG